MNSPKVPQTKDFFAHQREVSFFLRLHRHLPDKFCGGEPISDCNYREDNIAINELNQPVFELQKDPDFCRKEREVAEAVKAKYAEMGWTNNNQ